MSEGSHIILEDIQHRDILTGKQIATVIQGMRAPAEAGMSKSCQTGHVFGHGRAEMPNRSWGDGSAGKVPAGQFG